MARIEFHFNAPGLVPYACRLLRKVQARGLRTQVVGEPATLALLGQALWTFSSLDFLPHCLPEDTAISRQRSPVMLTPVPLGDWHREVLVNLGEAVPAAFEGFQRIIDVVTVDELHRAQGRERWREYTRQGHELLRHDLLKVA